MRNYIIFSFNILKKIKMWQQRNDQPDSKGNFALMRQQGLGHVLIY